MASSSRDAPGSMSRASADTSVEAAASDAFAPGAEADARQSSSGAADSGQLTAAVPRMAEPEPAVLENRAPVSSSSVQASSFSSSSLLSSSPVVAMPTNLTLNRPPILWDRQRTDLSQSNNDSIPDSPAASLEDDVVTAAPAAATASLPAPPPAVVLVAPATTTTTTTTTITAAPPSNNNSSDAPSAARMSAAVSAAASSAAAAVVGAISPRGRSTTHRDFVPGASGTSASAVAGGGNNSSTSSACNNNNNNSSTSISNHSHHGDAKLLLPTRCLNPASDINSRLDTQVEVRVYPCNNNSQQQNSATPTTPNKKKFTSFTIKPEGVIIQGANHRPGAAAAAAAAGGRHPAALSPVDLGTEYAMHVGRKLPRFELADTRACQLLVTTHGKSFWVVPAPEAFSRHSGTCRLLGDRKHPPAPQVLQVGDFLRVGSVGVVVIETHDGKYNHVLSEEKISKIMKDTSSTTYGLHDGDGETDGDNSEDSLDHDDDAGPPGLVRGHTEDDRPVCYMCFDEEDSETNPMITPCKCSGSTKFVHVECLRKWHTAEADNQICFLSSVDATCSVCKSTFKSDFKLKDGRHVKLFKSSLEPPYISLLVATKHEMAQRLFNTRFQLSFKTIMKPDGRNAHRPLLLGRSSASDMVLDYRTVSARHAAIRFKNGEFVFTDAGSSNGSYLYLRRPLELSPSQPVQFRLGRSMISMKVVNKWNRRLLRAVRRSGGGSAGGGGGSVNGGDADDEVGPDDRSIGSSEGDVLVSETITTVQGQYENINTHAVQRRTRDQVMQSLPPYGQLHQGSSKHLDLLYALAYPQRSMVVSSMMKETALARTGTGSSTSTTVAAASSSATLRGTALAVAEDAAAARPTVIGSGSFHGGDSTSANDDDGVMQTVASGVANMSLLPSTTTTTTPPTAAASAFMEVPSGIGTGAAPTDPPSATATTSH